MGDRWQFWIDRGGTFTDCLGYRPDTHEIRTTKRLSSDRAPIDCIREVLGLSSAQSIPPCDVRMGTTVATNALLERRGTPMGLVITRGFGDLLEIGTQARPELFELEIQKPERLYQAVLEVDARIDPSGRILERPDPDALKTGLRRLKDQGLESLAVVVLHAYAQDTLETEIEDTARQVGFTEVFPSHRSSRELGMLGRGDTTAIDAYLTPLIRAYVQTVADALPGSSLRIMQSSGGLTTGDLFCGRNAILSGPAGGVVAYARITEAEGFQEAIGFDMGGTSTDVSRFDGRFERVYETEVSGVRVRAPMMAIHTVAAGGGSLCEFSDERLTVGPKSAGAFPGPLCYGRKEAQKLALTDVNLALGRISDKHFPFRLDKKRVAAALKKLAESLGARGQHRTDIEVAEGFFEVANAKMAQAIRKVSIAKGYDLRTHVLAVFGGAGGQHACAIAKRLGIKGILFHPYAGVLSAYGMGLADVQWHGQADAGRRPLAQKTRALIEPLFHQLEKDGQEALAREGFSRPSLRTVRTLDLRYHGTDSSVPVAFESFGTLKTAFERTHQQFFGYLRPDHPIEVVTARVEIVAPGAQLHPQTHKSPQSQKTPSPTHHQRLFAQGHWHDQVPVFERSDLPAGTELVGPAVVLEPTSTIIIDPGFKAFLKPSGCLFVRDAEHKPLQPPKPTPLEKGAQNVALEAHEATGAPRREAPHPKSSEDQPGDRNEGVDPVKLEIFANLFMSIAEQMGTVLRRTALSTNIRERLDFSCAVFDRQGGLVANAPHIPVHLGAMGASVEGILKRHPHPAPGEVFATNDPAQGGSHLPDITVISPVHDAAGELRFFVASRGHHADVGGITPGSMPPFSQHIDEEGILFRGQRIVQDGRLDEAGLLNTLKEGAYPARDPQTNLRDLEAQIAANARGRALLLEAVEAHGLFTITAYMQHVQDNAQACVEDALHALGPTEARFADALDDGTPICVSLRIRDRRMTIDFAGTGGEVQSNLNAPEAVTQAAVMYVVRALVRRPIPLNRGCLVPITVRIPPHSLLSPGPTRAVSGGNVETSQRVVDVLLGALGQAAASQGTMNNVSFGDPSFGYYETIAGGAGASAGYAGASGVHTHMTNTRITDPEVLENRCPVRLRAFSIRRGSGGRGRFSGGDGLIRELEFLRPLWVSLLTERRTKAPFGLLGGEPGSRGINRLNGVVVGGKAQLQVKPGDRLRIETPGGGGYGSPVCDTDKAW